MVGLVLMVSVTAPLPTLDQAVQTTSVRKLCLVHPCMHVGTYCDVKGVCTSTPHSAEGKVALPLPLHPVHNVIHRCSLHSPKNRTCIMLFISCHVAWGGASFYGGASLHDKVPWPPICMYMKLSELLSHSMCPAFIIIFSRQPHASLWSEDCFRCLIKKM